MESILTGVYLEAITPDQQSLMYLRTGAFVVSTLQQCECVTFVFLLLRVSSAPALCAFPPDGVATQGCQLLDLKGASWTDSSVVEDSTLRPTLTNLVC